MRYRLRQISGEGKFCDEISVPMLTEVIGISVIDDVLSQCEATEQRKRKFTMRVVVLIVIAMNLMRELALTHVMSKLLSGLRRIWPEQMTIATDSALSYRRSQLGVRPMQELFRRVCRPMTTPTTPGAFLFGRRVVALDGWSICVADTPENVRVFGRPKTARGQSAFAHLQGVMLIECGSHGIIDAGFWPCGTSERQGGFRVLRSLTPEMLLMYDRGFHSFEMYKRVIDSGADLLARLPAGDKPELIRVLSDGSRLVRFRPTDSKRRREGQQIILRLIEYRITDPRRSDKPTEVHRLVTTLLDEGAYPALELIDAYHERWEVELVIDEVKTHLMNLTTDVLRSRTPIGVLQELYGLLLAHYVIRSLIYRATSGSNRDTDRVSFVHAVRLVTQSFAEFEMAAADLLPTLVKELLADFLRELLQPRRTRIYPRVVKRKMSNFKLKRPEHAHWPQPSIPFINAVLRI